MPFNLTGKGMYLWQIKRVLGGDPARIAQACVDAGLTHVWIKVADGIQEYNKWGIVNGREYYNLQSGEDLVPPLIAALRDRGISPWGWQYIYGTYPDREALLAYERCKSLGVDGFVINAEKEFERDNTSAKMDWDKQQRAAQTYSASLYLNMGGDMPIGFSSFRYPTAHPLPYPAFLGVCNFNAPQVYWIGSNNPEAQLDRSLKEYRAIRDIPQFPTGAAYGQVTADQIRRFMQASKDRGLAGCNFWEMKYAIDSHDYWSTISQFDYGTVVYPPTPQQSLQEQIDDLRADVRIIKDMLGLA